MADENVMLRYEVVGLKLENLCLKIERDMLKDALVNIELAYEADINCLDDAVTLARKTLDRIRESNIIGKR